MKAYILNISFKGLKPVVTRQVIMPENATFKRLFDTIMHVTNFTGEHLYQFETAEIIITNNDELVKASKRKSYDGKPVKSPSAKMDAQIEQGSMLLTYDFGDNWEIVIELEKTVDDYYFGFPTILTGVGMAPPENVGGVEGYKEFLKVYNNPQHEDYLVNHEWAEGQNYVELDVDFVNEQLKQVKYQKTEWDKLEHDRYILLKDAYRTADVFDVKRIHEADELARYIMACGNLYGYINMHAFLKIYNDSHTHKVSSKMVKSLAREATYVRQFSAANVEVYDDAIVHKKFDVMEDTELFFKRSFGKPYFIPSRKELLRYANGTYYEVTASTKALSKMVEKDMGQQTAVVTHMMNELMQELKSDTKFSGAVKKFISQIPIKNAVELNIYIQLITNVANTTRLWINRGFTPEELSGREKATAQTAATKVGRNDPCPCGSGKKYKKCCGK